MPSEYQQVQCWLCQFSVRLLNGKTIQQPPTIVASEVSLEDAMAQVEAYGKEAAPEAVGVLYHKIEQVPPLLRRTSPQLDLLTPTEQ